MYCRSLLFSDVSEMECMLGGFGGEILRAL
jgi:hypothetical protein